MARVNKMCSCNTYLGKALESLFWMLLADPADRTNTKVQLRNLEAKTEYRIKVAAHTNVGIGLDADIVDSTLEVSKYFFNYFFSLVK